VFVCECVCVYVCVCARAFVCVRRKGNVASVVREKRILEVTHVRYNRGCLRRAPLDFQRDTLNDISSV
jgi:hypothetical protein